MKAKLKSKKGTDKGDIILPEQFGEEIRPDLIKRAVLAVQNNRRQRHGVDPRAGKKHSSTISKRRRDYKTSYGHGISRVPRKILSRRGTRFNWVASTSPNTRGGRRAHPPKAEKVYSKKINKKERRKAIRSALSAVMVKEYVLKRGHKVEEYPFVLEKDAENIKKTKDVQELFGKLGLNAELERASKTTEKTGKARRRGNKKKTRVGPLLVVSDKCPLVKAASNIPGVDVVPVTGINAELLAPGTDYGRLTIFTEKAIEMLEKQKLFTDNIQIEKKSKE